MKLTTIEDIKPLFNHIHYPIEEFEHEWVDMKYAVMQWFVDVVNSSDTMEGDGPDACPESLCNWALRQALNWLASGHISHNFSWVLEDSQYNLSEYAVECLNKDLLYHIKAGHINEEQK